MKGEETRSLTRKSRAPITGVPLKAIGLIRSYVPRTFALRKIRLNLRAPPAHVPPCRSPPPLSPFRFAFTRLARAAERSCNHRPALGLVPSESLTRNQVFLAHRRASGACRPHRFSAQTPSSQPALPHDCCALQPMPFRVTAARARSRRPAGAGADRDSDELHREF